MRTVCGAALAAASLAAAEEAFTGPDQWRLVNTNAVAAWNAAQAAQPGAKTWRGVAADPQRREVRLLAESADRPRECHIELSQRGVHVHLGDDYGQRDSGHHDH